MTGEELPRKLREEVLALGSDAVGPLVELLRDEESWGDAVPGNGWPPIHAVDLLADLKATEAIEPMLHALVATDWIDILHDRLIQRLPEFGAPVLEPALALLGRATEKDARHSLCNVLAKLGVRDDRIFGALCDVFAEDKTFGAMTLSEYGDRAALPLLAESIERFRPNFESLIYESDLTELVEAHRHLGGVLPDESQTRVERWFARWAMMRRELFSPLVQTAPRTARKIGRNQLCPCGSGKKYKKCCIDAREGSPEPRVITGDGDSFLVSEGVSAEQFEMAREYFAEKDAGRGPGKQMVDFAQPLIDETDGSTDALSHVLNLSTFFWNIAVLPDNERREGMLADMAERFAGDQREDFERTARMMIERHRTMFPEWHSR
jgi:hypothetical protein